MTYPHDSRPAVQAMLNELGKAMCDQQAVAIVRYQQRQERTRGLDQLAASWARVEAVAKARRAADELAKLTDDMGMYDHTRKQEAS